MYHFQTKKIKEGISTLDFLLVVLSENSVNLDWVKRELDEAVEIVDSKEAFILPALLEECEIPLLLKDEKYVSSSEDPESAYQELVEAINYHWKT